jgi:hypothetical protein
MAVIQARTPPILTKERERERERWIQVASKIRH